MKITLKQLRYLIALVDEGHFGRGAARVSITQPALSVQIRDLEATLGVQLIERGARDAVATPAGHEIVRRARRILDEVREIEQVARWHSGLSGRLRIGVIPTVAPYLLPQALPELRARNVALDLGIREAQTEQLLEDVRTGVLDAAIVALPLDGADLIVEPLFDDRFLLAGSVARLDALGLHQRRPDPDALDAGSLLLLDEGHCLTGQIFAACALDNRRAPMDLRAASLATLCRLVSEGFGMTLLPELAAAAECAAAPGLSIVRFAEPQPMRTIVLVRRKISVDDGWVNELVGILATAGTTVSQGCPRMDHLPDPVGRDESGTDQLHV